MRHGRRIVEADSAEPPSVNRRQWFARTAAAAAAMCGARQAGAVQVTEAETSRRVREQAIADLPLQQLVPQARQRVMEVVERPTLFRRMPTEQILCSPDLFVFLVRYPEVVVNMWDLMGATKLSVSRVGKYLLDSNDGAGTKTRVELIYGNQTQHLMYAKGAYSGPLFRRQLHGQCVMMINSAYQRNKRGEEVVTCTMDVFLSLDNVGIDIVAKTLHPLMGNTADHNFAESARFVSQVSEQTKKNPAGMQRLSRRLEKVEPSIRDKFSATIRDVTGASPLAADVEPDTRVVKPVAAPMPATRVSQRP